METNYCGVNLEAYQCHKLVPDPIYSKYTKEQLHYPIGAIQKGLKPHTKIGIKRIQKRNKKKLIRNTTAIRGRGRVSVAPVVNADQQSVKKLNPKSPEQICMKALRKEFRQKLETSHMELEVSKTKVISKNQIKRKQNQKARRKQLNKLVKKYKTELYNIFGMERFCGYGRCPKISRQQIYKALNIKPEPIQYEVPKKRNNNPTIRRVELNHSSFPIVKDVIDFNKITNKKLPNLESTQEFPTLK